MISITQRHTHVRIWLDELPPWSYESAEVFELRRELDVKCTEKRSAALELLVHTGPRIHYGALGAEFIPEQRGALVVQVATSIDKGPLVTDSLAGKLDTVRSGLPQEYVRGVLENVLDTDELQFLGAGRLRFCRAAHGSVGSSLWMFGVLTRIVVKLLNLDRQSSSEEHLLELIRLELSHR